MTQGNRLEARRDRLRARCGSAFGISALAKSQAFCDAVLFHGRIKMRSSLSGTGASRNAHLAYLAYLGRSSIKFGVDPSGFLKPGEWLPPDFKPFFAMKRNCVLLLMTEPPIA
eukprot:s1194_g2.t1